ncbi:MAG: hypothetical protein U9Q66_03665 [Patescibacteria group bacterium]|nr:hypothetical protein [Patescibacteria group bacterium]
MIEYKKSQFLLEQKEEYAKNELEQEIKNNKNLLEKEKNINKILVLM